MRKLCSACLSLVKKANGTQITLETPFRLVAVRLPSDGFPTETSPFRHSASRVFEYSNFYGHLINVHHENYFPLYLDAKLADAIHLSVISNSTCASGTLSTFSKGQGRPFNRQLFPVGPWAHAAYNIQDRQDHNHDACSTTILPSSALQRHLIHD